MAKNNSPGSRAEQKAATAAKREARREKAARQAAALAAERKARQRKERLVVGGVVFALLAVIALGTVWALNRGPGEETAAPPKGAVDEFALAIGDEDAPNTVEVYLDFECGVCAQWEAQSAAALAQAAEEGQVRVKYLPVKYLNRVDGFSERAANAMAVVFEAAGPEVAITFQESLFAQQPTSRRDNNDDDWLVEKAVAAGAEEDDVRPGIEDRAFAKWVDNATEAASKRGVRGTPTVFLNGDVFNHADVFNNPAGMDLLLGAFN